MKQTLPLIPVLLATACAQKAPPADGGSGGLVQRELLLWEVEKGGAVSTLLGTCHLAIPLDAALPPVHQVRLDEARVLLTELDLARMDPIVALRAIQRGPDQPDLRSQLSSEAWRALAVQVRELIPAPMLMELRPWGAWSVLLAADAGSPRPGSAGGTVLVLDLAVSHRAGERGVPRKALETVEDQLTMIGSMDPAFLEMLEGGGGGEGGMSGPDATLELCATGDARRFEALLADPTNAELLEPMLAARNRRWMEPLLPELEQGGAFVAVGAGHMLGDHGLLALVEEQGFEVRRLKGKVPVRAFSLASGSAGLGVVKAPPPVEPERVLAWTTHLQGELPPLVCAPGNPLVECLYGSIEACEQGTTADVPPCVEQWADLLPGMGEPLQGELATRLPACVMTGGLLRAIMSSRPASGPVCTAIFQQIEAAMQQSLP